MSPDQCLLGWLACKGAAMMDTVNVSLTLTIAKVCDGFAKEGDLEGDDPHGTRNVIINALADNLAISMSTVKGKSDEDILATVMSHIRGELYLIRAAGGTKQ